MYVMYKEKKIVKCIVGSVKDRVIELNPLVFILIKCTVVSY